jgi:hypothetical protein
MNSQYIGRPERMACTPKNAASATCTKAINGMVEVLPLRVGRPLFGGCDRFYERPIAIS